jgi:hypothetical protein
MYCPVRRVARDGQQSGKLTKLLVNVVPLLPSRSWVRGMNLICSTVWSSVMTITKLGRATAAGPPPDAGVADATTARTAPRIRNR